MTYDIKDSGARQEFDGGMVRDTEEGKIDFTNLFLHFEPMGTRYAAHMTKGRKKYPDPEVGTPNWKLADADPELVERFKRSAARHFKQWLRGDDDEDHAAAVLFNINGAEYVQEMIDDDDDYEAMVAKFAEGFDTPKEIELGQGLLDPDKKQYHASLMEGENPLAEGQVLPSDQEPYYSAKRDMFVYDTDEDNIIVDAPLPVFGIERNGTHLINGERVTEEEFYDRFMEAMSP